jgi:hypothetical protein
MKTKKLNLLEGRTKEWNLDETQGRTKKQYEDNAKSMTFGCFGFLTILVSIIIYGIIF